MSLWGNVISGSLIVMALSGLLQYIFTFDVNTVSVTFKMLRDFVALPNFTGLTENFLEIIVQGFLITFIVLVTTLITARALDPKASFDNEIKNQSIVNAISALLGAFPTTTGFIRTIILKRNKRSSDFSCSGRIYRKLYRKNAIFNFKNTVTKASITTFLLFSSSHSISLTK